jgi:serine/threonine-protein kinase RsbW
MNLPDPTSPENIEKENGRGIFLIQNLSDSLDFEESGKVAVISFDK